MDVMGAFLSSCVKKKTVYLRLTDIIGREGEEMGLGLVAWI